MPLTLFRKLIRRRAGRQQPGLAPGRVMSAALAIAGLSGVGGCAGSQTPHVSLGGVSVSQIAASVKRMGPTAVTLRYYVPGTSIATDGAPWPFYSGKFDFHSAAGTLAITGSCLHWLSSTVSWSLSGSESILVANKPQPSTRAFASMAARPSGSSGSSGSSQGSQYPPSLPGVVRARTSALVGGTGGTSGGGPSYGERIVFSRISEAGALDPVQTYMAIVVNPLFWVDLLAGSSGPLGRGEVSSMSGRPAVRYDVVLDLDKAAAATGGSQGTALRWLATYLDDHEIPAQLWLAGAGNLVGMRMVRVPRTSPMPHAIADFPDPASHPDLTLVLNEPANGTSGSSSTSSTDPVAPAGIARPTGAAISPEGLPSVAALALGTAPDSGSPSIPEGMRGQPGEETPRTDPVFNTLGEAGGPRPACKPAGHTGLSAAAVAHAGQHVTGIIHTRACDVGVYVGSGVNGVVISDATIVGSNAHAVMVVNADDTVIKDSTLANAFNNVIDMTLLPQMKAILLVGTERSIVEGNTGVPSTALVDDGAVDPGALNPGLPSPGRANRIEGNYPWSWFPPMDCVLVVASYNPGEGLSQNVITGNDLHGGVTVAADAAGTTVDETTVRGNTLTAALLPGVVVHSNAAGDVIKDTLIVGNTLEGDADDPMCGLKVPAGIAVIGAAGIVSDTKIAGNVIYKESVGVWLAGATGSSIQNNDMRLGKNGKAIVQLARPGCTS